MNPLMSNTEKPRDNIVKGKVSNTKAGLTNALPNPINKPVINNVSILSTAIPKKRSSTIQRDRELTPKNKMNCKKLRRCIREILAC